jgi:ribosomal protein S21
VRIVVFDNQVEAALKQLKKQMLKDGLYQEMKKRAYYEKPRPDQLGPMFVHPGPQTFVSELGALVRALQLGVEPDTDRAAKDRLVGGRVVPGARPDRVVLEGPHLGHPEDAVSRHRAFEERRQCRRLVGGWGRWTGSGWILWPLTR